MGNYTIAAGQTLDEIRSTDATNTVDNSGRIWGHGPNGILREAIWLSGGTSATIKNKASGVIEATNAPAIFISANTATIENAGLIQTLSPGQTAIRATLNTNSNTTVVNNTGRITAGENGDAIVLVNTGSGKLKVLNSGQIDGGVDAARLENSGIVTRVGSADLMLTSSLTNSGTITTAQINGTAEIKNTGSITADAVSAVALNNNSANSVVTAKISTAFDNVYNIGTINGGALMTVKGMIDNQGDLNAGRINTVTGDDALSLTLGLAEGRGVNNVGEIVTGILDTHELMNYGTVTLNYTGGNNVPSATTGFFATELSDILVLMNFGTVTADVIHGGELHNSGTVNLIGASTGPGFGVATEFQKITNVGLNNAGIDGHIYGDVTGDEISNLGYIHGVVTLKDINGDGKSSYDGNGGYSENVIRGTSIRDSVYGGYLSDTIHGGGGNDQLSGNHGDDLIFGDGGNDSLSADTGNDTLNGGSGSDKLYFGGFGETEATGGSGNDQFHFHVFGSTPGTSTITDFQDTKDKIYIRTNGDTRIDSWGDIADDLAQLDADTVLLDLSDVGGSKLEIDGVTLNQLSSADFVFV